MSPKPPILPVEELTEREMEVVTTVFRSFETGLREATIYPKDLHVAMKMLGLNPMEQEIIDLTNEIARNGFIYFPEFCNIVLKKFREDDEEAFRQNLFKMLCGTEPFPELFRAKKYKLYDNYIMKEDFHHIMRNLPVPVTEEDIEQMFDYADKDKDGKINYMEFQTMINPPPPPQPPKPSIKDLKITTARLETGIILTAPTSVSHVINGGNGCVKTNVKTGASEKQVMKCSTIEGNVNGSVKVSATDPLPVPGSVLPAASSGAAVSSSVTTTAVVTAAVAKATTTAAMPVTSSGVLPV